MSTKLEALFNRYAADLERYRPQHRGMFSCPLCLALIERTETLADVVAEEHVVPEALGGRMTTLTCRKCNDTAGSELESHLIQRVRVDAFKQAVHARVEIGGAVQRAEVHFPNPSADGFRIFGISKQSDPRQVADMQRLLAEGESSIRLHLNMGYVVLRSAVALIRSAYLLMFRTFGYRYVLDQGAAGVRDQIAKPAEETVVLKGVSWRLEAGAPAETSVAIVTAPALSQSFAALLKLDEEPDHVAAVALPPPGAVASEFYQTLAQQSSPRTCQLKVLPPTNGFLPMDRLWKDVLEHAT